VERKLSDIVDEKFLSPDGKFIWTGDEWIPAPPGIEVIEQPEDTVTTTPEKVTNPSAEVTDAEHQKTPISESMHLELIRKKRFALVPTVTLGFRDDFRGIEEHVVFHQKTRKIVVKTTDGSLLGTIKMNGLTIVDGFSGPISFPTGESYFVELKVGIGGVKMVNVLDEDGSRNCSIET